MMDANRCGAGNCGRGEDRGGAGEEIEGRWQRVEAWVEEIEWKRQRSVLSG
jgi:hypothetical protein